MILVDNIKLLVDGKDVNTSYIESFEMKGSRVEHGSVLNVSFFRKGLLGLYEKGQNISLSVGYDGIVGPTEVFEGFISDVSETRDGVEIKCQDYSLWHCYFSIDLFS